MKIHKNTIICGGFCKWSCRLHILTLKLLASYMTRRRAVLHGTVFSLLRGSRCPGSFRSTSQWRRNKWCRVQVYSKCNLFYLHFHTSPGAEVVTNCMQGNPFYQESPPKAIPSSLGTSLPPESTPIGDQGRKQTRLLLSQLPFLFLAYQNLH